MPRPVLILINGIPGTGKTTLSHKLAKDLNIPCVGKDDIKEMLFDKMGIDGEELSKDQGAAASEMQFVLIETFIQRGRDLIAESAFFKQIATPRIIDIIQKSDVNYVEIYCKADTAVWRQRFIERAKSGKRHPGHVDLRKPISEAEAIERYAPLGIGKVIEFDTTVISDQSYDHLLAKIKDCLKGV